MTTKTTEKKETTKKSVYERLSKIDVSKYLKEIQNKYKDKYGHERSFSLKYLSWARAWGLVKAIYPDASYKIKEYPNWLRTADGNYQQAGTLDYRITSVGCEVEVTVTINDVDYTQKLYPMDSKNKPIMKPNIKDINKAQLRCLVKALATAGLGLGVYAGEDLPSNEDETATKPEKRKPKPVESLSQRIAKAKQFEVQYGGGKEKLVDVCKWEAQGDEQAKAFLDNWRTKSQGNEAAYNFIKDQGLQKESA